MWFMNGTTVLSTSGFGNLPTTWTVRQMIDRRHFIVGVLALPMGGIGVANAAQSVGSVVSETGSAFLVRSANRIPAGRGAEVLLDDLASTGELSRLELLLGRGTHIKLGSRASLKIDRFVAGVRAEVELREGPALVDRPSGAEPDFSVTSPYALIAARGTRFFAGPSNGVFGVFVQHGQVDVRTRRGAVSLRAGEGTDIAFPGARPTPPKKWGAPRVAKAMSSVG
jgi:ferric-dicitrate binding protein FerR (iron transport regulator)